MNWSAINFDWNQVRAFLATAEEGSLSAAARALGQTQPTLSRQVSALEEALGVTLFERGRRSTVLTDSGRELLGHVRTMGDAAHKVSLIASGQQESIKGKVSITATNVMMTYHLPPLIAQIRREAPDIELELIASNDVQDLSRREADIAIRHARPEQPDLIARLLLETRANIYAAPTLLERQGRPRDLEDLQRYDFIGIDKVERMLPHLASQGLNLKPEHFKIQTGSGTAMIQFARMGLGLCFLTSEVRDIAPDLVCVLPEAFSIPVPVWLVTHRELQTSRRIRLVFNILAEGLKQRSA